MSVLSVCLVVAIFQYINNSYEYLPIKENVLNEKNLKSLYDGLIKKGYSKDEIGNEATFKAKMADKNNRRQLYDYVTKRGDFRIGDYDSYEQRLVYTETAQKESIKQVYVCTGRYSKTYHKNRFCKGLSKCKASVKRIDLKQAKKKGRRACKICY